ncbi:MAG: D-alanyl-D-alanine carboxypeptidase, partial [Methyloceanibacter sp.]
MNVSRWARLALTVAFALAVLAAPSAEAASRRSKSATPKIAASIVVDMNTGTILYSEAAEQPRAPASLTKMMTLYVLFGYLRAGKITPDSELVVTAHAA